MKFKTSILAVILCLAACLAAFGQVSVPVVPSQPSVSAYGFSDLNELQTWTRASYQQKFGVQAPAYDQSQPTRLWFDSSATPGPYQVIQVNGPNSTPLAQLVALPVPTKVNVPNLPGYFQYPAYQNLPATTVAVQVWGGGLANTSVPVSVICSAADAQAVSVSFGLGAVVGQDSSYGNAQWGTETRRPYTVTPKGGQVLQACPLRVAMTRINVDPSGNYAGGGVGAPGGWSNATGSAPLWNITPDPGLTASSNVTPVPVRSLLPNEQFSIGPLATIQISRTDVSGAASSGAGSWTAGQQLYICQVLDALNKTYSLDVTPPVGGCGQ